IHRRVPMHQVLHPPKARPRRRHPEQQRVSPGPPRRRPARWPHRHRRRLARSLPARPQHAPVVEHPRHPQSVHVLRHLDLAIPGMHLDRRHLLPRHVRAVPPQRLRDRVVQDLVAPQRIRPRILQPVAHHRPHLRPRRHLCPSLPIHVPPDLVSGAPEHQNAAHKVRRYESFSLVGADSDVRPYSTAPSISSRIRAISASGSASPRDAIALRRLWIPLPTSDTAFRTALSRSPGSTGGQIVVVRRRPARSSPPNRSSRSSSIAFRAANTPSHIRRFRLTFCTSGWISTSSAAPERSRPESPNAVRGVSLRSCSIRNSKSTYRRCTSAPPPCSRSSRYARDPSRSSHFAPGPTRIPSEPSTFSSTAIGAPDSSSTCASTLIRRFSS